MQIIIKSEWEVNNFKDERQFQAKFTMIVSQLFPRLRDKVWHTPNEHYLPKVEGEDEDAYKLRCQIWGNRMKAQGVLSGVMDTLFVHNGILYKIELKQPGGSLSPSQEKLHELWTTDCPETRPIVIYTIAEGIRYIIKVLERNLKINFV